MDILKKVHEIEAEVIANRRHFHKHPELSWQEIETQKTICQKLDEMNIPYKQVCKTGVVAFIGNRNSAVKIGVRADIDALPVVEDTNLAFSSVNSGVMHACGHDGHIATALGAAKVLKDMEDSLTCEVRFFFQPAEESIEHGGAEEMILLDEFKTLTNIVGLHIWNPLPVGKISVQKGPRMASADTFDIKIIGKGGHGAMPHQAVDPVVAATSLVCQLQTLVSRKYSPMEPVVISICKIEGGSTYNVIPSDVKLAGTVRAFNPKIRDGFKSDIEEVIDGVCKSFRTSYTFDYYDGAPAVINDTACSQKAEAAAVKLFGQDAVVEYQPVMAAEDFSNMLTEKPGCFAFVGSGTDSCFPHHNQKFDISESALAMGVAFFVGYVLEHN